MSPYGGTGRPALPCTDRTCTYVLFATATGELPEADSQWSHRLLAEHLADDGISASQIGRILADLDLKPHRVRGWLTRRADPNFLRQGRRDLRPVPTYICPPDRW